MNKALKATLLSLLVFPGLGHLLLKKYPQALFFIVTTSIACYLLISNVVAMAMHVVAQIEHGQIGATPIEVINAINLQTTSGYSNNSHLAMWFILLSWVVAAVDSYRLGR